MLLDFQSAHLHLLDDEGLRHPPPLVHLVVAVGARLHLLGRVRQLPLHLVRLGVLRRHELGLKGNFSNVIQISYCCSTNLS